MNSPRTKHAVVSCLALAAVLILNRPAQPPRVPPPSNAALKPPDKPGPAAKIGLLLFTQANCAPCRDIEAALNAENVQALIAERFDLEEVAWPDDRFAQYGVRGTPTLIALLPSGNRTRAGGMNAGQLLAWLQSLATTQRAARRPFAPSVSGKIVEAGYDGPDGRRVMIEFPAEWWKANIVSRGQGCCGFRSIDFAAHWQNVLALWGFPEWLKAKGMPGGAYSENVTERIGLIAKDRNATEPDYINVESKDWQLLKLVIATGRLPCVDYSGADGVHYSGRIAHCVCLVYVDDDYVAILDNNFPPDKLLWMPASEFKKRWGGWIIALCAPRPPAPPHN